MDVKDFYYHLPEELIAQNPADKRDCSRLLVTDKNTGEFEDRHFYDIIDYLNEGDCLVLNNTKVISARLYGKKTETGAACEVLLLRQRGLNKWECLVRPGKKLRVGAKIEFEGVCAEITDTLDDGEREITFDYDGDFYALLDKIGNIPLPPYITKSTADKSRYQTVYAKTEGSAAAPTAGLHFTDELLEKIRAKGVKIAFVTLHIGIGTFRPVKVDKVEDHVMHSEWYSISKESAELINSVKQSGKRVVAVGTTSVRVLESASDEKGLLKEKEGDTAIFIYPPYKFKVVDALITNFHLPESTLIMLVSSLAGRENILRAYNHAVEERYRFFSFGDAMLIL